jgi:hypothetical protein
MQFNSKDVFGYMPLPKESWLRYMKLSKSENQGKKDNPQTYKPGTIYEAQQDVVYVTQLTCLDPTKACTYHAPAHLSTEKYLLFRA